jgi:hypothetical protein
VIGIYLFPPLNLFFGHAAFFFEPARRLGSQKLPSVLSFVAPLRAARSTIACMILSLSQEAYEITFELPWIETDSSVLHAKNAALIND